jgi:predicted phage gp36 major capsid-like protein
VSEAPDNETAATLALAAHVLGASHRPIGARGVFAWWRTGSGVLVANAARYLEVK